MPHSTETTTENQAVVNGEVNSSEFLSHLNSHPIVSDSVSAFKQNYYGSLTITYADKSYSVFVSPFIPYARTPYSYVQPYVERADKFAAQGLDKVDATFPIVTKDTDTIVNSAYDIIILPQKVALETKDYVFSTWSQEYKANGGNGIVAGSKALVTTSLSITSDTLSWVSKWLGQAKAHGEAAVKEVKEKSSN